MEAAPGSPFFSTHGVGLEGGWRTSANPRLSSKELILTPTAAPQYRVLAFLSNILLHECGYHVLLFNSRGVGKSSGWPSLTGLTEGRDLEELVQWGLGAVPNVKSLVLIVRAVCCIPRRRRLIVVVRVIHMALLSRPCTPSSLHQSKPHICYSRTPWVQGLS